MRTKEDVESYLLRSQLSYEEVADGMWVVRDSYNRLDQLVVKLSGPILLFRMKVMEVPETGREALFQRLLELNASELMHVAYGIEGDAVVLTHATEIANFDHNEFQAVIDDLSVAMGSHHEALAPFRRASAAPPAPEA